MLSLIETQSFHSWWILFCFNFLWYLQPEGWTSWFNNSPKGKEKQNFVKPKIFLSSCGFISERHFYALYHRMQLQEDIQYCYSNLPILWRYATKNCLIVLVRLRPNAYYTRSKRPCHSYIAILYVWLDCIMFWNFRKMSCGPTCSVSSSASKWCLFKTSPFSKFNLQFDFHFLYKIVFHVHSNLLYNQKHIAFVVCPSMIETCFHVEESLSKLFLGLSFVFCQDVYLRKMFSVFFNWFLLEPTESGGNFENHKVQS